MDVQAKVAWGAGPRARQRFNSRLTTQRPTAWHGVFYSLRSSRAGAPRYIRTLTLNLL
ncbi:MAG: hypothetical protein H7330_08995 [Hymenobacteraceae bacterium]|nr:hypothetical protein [Hymenobacteraceae bacterium]